MGIRLLNLFTCLSFILQPGYAYSQANLANFALATANDFLAKNQQQQACNFDPNNFTQIQDVLRVEPFPNDLFPNCLNLDARLPNANNGFCEQALPLNNCGQAEQYDLTKNRAFTLAEQYDIWASESLSNLDNVNPNTQFQNPQTLGFNQRQIGNQCLQRSIDDLQVALNERLTRLSNLRNDMTQRIQEINDNLEKTANSLREGQAVLSGGEGNLLNNNSRIYSGLFESLTADGASCGSVFSSEKVQQDSSGGLRNILSELDDIRVDRDGNNIAEELILNKNRYQNDILDLASRISQSIRNVGVETALQQDQVRGISSFGFDESDSFDYAYDSTVQDINENIGKLRQRYGDLQANIPESDVFKFGRTSFEEKLRTFKRDQELLCVKEEFGFRTNDEDWANVVLNPSDLRDRQRNRNKNSNNEGISRNLLHYRSEALEILTNPFTENDEKQSALAALDRRFRDITFSNNDTNGGTRAGNISRLLSSAFQEHQRTCERNLTESRAVYSGETGEAIGRSEHPEGLSVTDTIAQARAIHQDFKRIEQTTASRVEAAITERLIDCRDQGKAFEYSNSPGQCNEEKLSSDSSSFCLNQSVQCAQQAQNCGTRLNESIESIIVNMRQEADNANLAVQQFVQAQKQLLQEETRNFLQTSLNLQDNFRHNFAIEIPSDLTIDLPTPQIGDTEGIDDVALINPEEAFDQFLGGIDELITSIEAENREVIRTAEAEQTRLRSNWQAEAERWRGIQNQCQDQLLTLNNNIANHNQEQLNAQQERDQRLLEACNAVQTRAIAGQTAGGDDLSSLISDVQEVANAAPGSGIDVQGLQRYTSCVNGNTSLENNKDKPDLELATKFCRKNEEDDNCKIVQNKTKDNSPEDRKLSAEILVKNNNLRVVKRTGEICNFDLPTACNGVINTQKADSGRINQDQLNEFIERSIATGT